MLRFALEITMERFVNRQTGLGETAERPGRRRTLAAGLSRRLRCGRQIAATVLPLRKRLLSSRY